jgi:hypothetical protein
VASAVRDADIDRNLGCSNEFGLPRRQPRDRVGNVFGLSDSFRQQRLMQPPEMGIRFASGVKDIP